MARTIRLGERLMKIAGMVKRGASIIDVGTDHAYLPAYLLLCGAIDAAKASDIRPGPIARAEQTRRRFCLKDRLELFVCPGLRDFSTSDADTIIIAGMGGETIAAILDEAPWTRDGLHRLILQPMTSPGELRRYLFENGYEIYDEVLARDRGRLYTILDARGGGPGDSARLPFEYFASRHVLGDDLAGAYLELQLNRIGKRIDGLLHSRTPGRGELSFLRDAVDGLTQLKREWEECRR